LFKYGFDAGYLDRPVRFGPGFAKPTKARMRLHRAASEKKLFTREKIRAMLDGALVVGENGPELVRASTQMKAMILLGINGGLGNRDCGMLPVAALDLDGGWLHYARPKTGIDRKIPLWPETVQALRDVLGARPAPKKPEAEGRVFVTKYGGSWARP